MRRWSLAILLAAAGLTYGAIRFLESPQPPSDIQAEGPDLQASPSKARRLRNRTVLTSSEQADAVLNEAGIPIKVITTRDCKLYEDADGSSKGAPCPVFKYWYVLPPEPNAPSREAAKLPSIKKNGFYRVASGDSEAEARGWLQEDDVIEWSHREAVRLTPRWGRQAACFYKTEEEAIRAVETGEVGTPVLLEAPGADLDLMPLLGVSRRNVRDEVVKVFRVAILAGMPATRIPGSEALGAPEVRKVATLDLVFVVDTVMGMEGPIEQLRKAVATIRERLSSAPDRKARLRLGLVAYRDIGSAVKAMEYVARVTCTLAEGQDHGVFAARLQSLETARAACNLDGAEDALAGLWLALDEPALAWNQHAWRHVVLVTDASIKESRHPRQESRKNQASRTIAALRAKAQPAAGFSSPGAAAFVVSAVLAGRPKLPDDHAIAERQLGEIVRGRLYDGKIIRGDVDTGEFAAALAEDVLRKLGAFWEAIAEPREHAATRTVRRHNFADLPGPLLDLLATLLPEGSRLRSAADLRSVYCTDFDHYGNLLLEPGVFVQKGTLQNFQSFIHVLKNALEDSDLNRSRSIESVVDTLKFVCASLLSGSPMVRNHICLEEFFHMVIGLPVKTPIFNMTLERIGAMSQSDYDDWVMGIDASDQTLKTLLEDPNIWVKLHPDAKDRQMHAFIPLSDLP